MVWEAPSTLLSAARSLSESLRSPGLHSCLSSSWPCRSCGILNVLGCPLLLKLHFLFINFRRIIQCRDSAAPYKSLKVSSLMPAKQVVYRTLLCCQIKVPVWDGALAPQTIHLLSLRKSSQTWPQWCWSLINHGWLFNPSWPAALLHGFFIEVHCPNKANVFFLIQNIRNSCHGVLSSLGKVTN